MFSDKRRGDIWWMVDTHRKPADTCLIRGDRPVIVVSGDSANQTCSTVTVVPTTSSSARLARDDGYCDNVLLLGYSEPSMALPRQVHGVDRADLQQMCAALWGPTALTTGACTGRAQVCEATRPRGWPQSMQLP